MSDGESAHTFFTTGSGSAVGSPNKMPQLNSLEMVKNYYVKYFNFLILYYSQDTLNLNMEAGDSLTLNNGDIQIDDSLITTKSLTLATDQIDFILVWSNTAELSTTSVARERRRVFEQNLQKEGLELEYVPEGPNGLVFVKIHAPLPVLKRYAEILKMRLPMKKVR